MSQDNSKIREAIVKTAVQDWLDQENPFSDIVYKKAVIDRVTEELGNAVDKNDVEYAWKLMTEEGYFRKRKDSRRITAKEIDEAEELGVDTPMDEAVQTEILRVLAEAEREDVNHPEVTRKELLDRLDEYDPEVVDYNMLYCRSQGWADVNVYISNQPWQSAKITRFGRNMVTA